MALEKYYPSLVEFFKKATALVAIVGGVLAMIISIVAGVDLEVFFVVADAFIGVIISIWVAIIIADAFFSAAADKGYADVKYFWYALILGVVGYLLIIALPDRGSASPVSYTPDRHPAQKPVNSAPVAPRTAAQGYSAPVQQAKVEQPAAKPAVWTCEKCGYENSAHLVKCQGCGKFAPDYVPPVEDEPVRTWTCSECGSRNSGNTRYCYSCSHRRP